MTLAPSGGRLAAATCVAAARRGAALAAAALAALVLAAPRRAAAEPPVPAADADAAWRRRVDVGPQSDDPAARRAWARESATAGRERAGTALGGDLLAAAAGGLLGAGLDPPQALAWAREAVATYPPGSAGLALAWLHLANAHAWAGEPAAVLEALSSADAAAARAPPPSWDARDRRAAEEGARRVAEAGPLHRARALSALGRHAEAADVWEALAARGERTGLHESGRAWREAAVAAWRAGDRERARSAGRRAADFAATDDDAVDRAMWNLLAAHGLLDEAGEPRLSNAWPGPAFLDDARAAVRALEGRRGAWRVALQAASVAMLSRRREEALELYEKAFTDRGFDDEARASPFFRQTLVTAAHVAVEAGRPRDALRWLRTAEHAAGGPIPDTEALKQRIDELFGRDASGDAAPAAGAAPAGSGAPSPAGGTSPPAPAPPAVPRSGARLGPLGDGEGPSSPPEGAGPAAEADRREVLVALLAAALLLALLLVAVALARRRRRPP